MSYCLQYRTNQQCPFASSLATGECIVRPTANADGTKKWWMLWFCFVRSDNQQREVAAVPIAPNGAPDENGVGGRTWALTNMGAGLWRVTPSINVLDHPEGLLAHPGEHPDTTLVSVWHETPDIVYVPSGEPWVSR